MNIVITANTSWYLCNFQRNLIRSLTQSGHKVTIIAPKDDYSFKLVKLGATYCPIRLVQRGKNPLTEMLTCYDLFRLLHYIKPDYVLSFTPKSNLYIGLCSRFLSFKQISNISGLGEVFNNSNRYLKHIVSAMYKLTLYKNYRIFFQNQEDMKRFINTGLAPQNLCTCIPGSGSDLTKFCPSPAYMPKAPLKFLMFGRLVPSKGYDLFLRVAREVNADCKRAEFWIMGIQDKSRKESRKLYERIIQYHERGIINYLPPHDDVTTILQSADVVILPSSYSEGVPKSLIESLACGKVIITTNLKGCRNTVEHGRNGFLIRPGSIQDLKYRVLELINMPIEHLQEMGKASRVKAVNEFSDRVIIRAYLQEIAPDKLGDFTHNERSPISIKEL